MTEARSILRTRGDLLGAGHTPRAIADACVAGDLHRVRRGWYVDGEEWRSLWTESQHLVLVAAAAQDAGGTFIASHLSAAVLHGLPLYRVAPKRVHVTVGPRDRRSVDDVFRHEGPLPDADVTIVSGIRCTTLDRTVLDVARSMSTEVALACADAAVSTVRGGPRSFDDDAGDRWVARLRKRSDAPRVRGIRYARLVCDLVDGRAELPLESVVRLQLSRLGFGRPILQLPIPAPGGGRYWADIHLPDRGLLVECDGRSKYSDPGLRDGADLEAAIMAEKEREDWIRGVTGMRIIRVRSADARSSHALAARLTAFRVQLPAPPRPVLATRPLAYGV